MERLSHLTIRGFRSIRELNKFELRPVNILIGPNGAGKSNLVAFFRLLSFMSATPGLQDFIGRCGGGRVLLFDGPKRTSHIEIEICFTNANTNEYFARLSYAAPDRLIFTEEKIRYYAQATAEQQHKWFSMGSGHAESNLHIEAEQGGKTAQVIRRLIRNCKVHQFHDTSAESSIRGKWSVTDNKYLKENGGNLAPFLLRLQSDEPSFYGRIIGYIRQVFPQFLDFFLEADYGQVILQWRERGTEMVFSAPQASDGSLRTMALIAMLAQPEEYLPSLIVLDEPELGLHPSAVAIVAGLIRSASLKCQIVVATQSPNFLDHFEPDDIIVVDRPDRESIFRRLNQNELTEWLSDYSLSELWEKNVIGGRP